MNPIPPVTAGRFSRRSFLALGGAALLAAAAPSGAWAGRRPAGVFAGDAARPDERLALWSLHYVDVENGRLVENRTIVVERGRIAAIVGADGEIPADCRVVDCRGLVLLPGLINAHCHLNLFGTTNIGPFDFGAALDQIRRNYEDCLAWGITTARDMGCSPALMGPDREAIERGARVGPHILSAMGFVTVKGGYPDFIGRLPLVARAAAGHPARYVATPAEARDAVRRLADQGANLIKISLDHRSLMYGQGRLNVLSDAQLRAIKEEAARLSLPVAAHHLFVPGFERGLRFELDSLEHVATDAPLTDEQIARAVERRVPFVPTLTSRINLSFAAPGDAYFDDPHLQWALDYKEWELLPEIPAHCNTRLAARCRQLLAYYRAAEYAKPENAGRLSFNPPVFARGVVLGTANLRRLIAAGAVIGAGNDAGVPFTFPGMFHHELSLLAQAGLTNAQALRAATAVNAKICRVDDRCGTIAAGKHADLLLLAANPLDDLCHLTKIQAVFKEGRILFRAADFSRRMTG